MKALRSHVAGGPETLTLDDVPDPVPGPGDVVIAVEAAALNYPDVLLIEDRYQVRPPRPFSPGSEVAGTIAAVGPDVAGLAIGDRVIGIVPWGGLVEKLLLPASACLPIADGVAMDEAAALIVTYATSHYALRDLAEIRPGETLLVLGASGGVGIAAVQLSKAFGAHVVAAVSSPAKAELVRTLGADAAIVYPTDLNDRAAAKTLIDAFRAACPSGAADVVFDPVGGPFSEPAFRTLAWQGRHLVVGFTAGISSLPLNLTLLKGARVIGVSYGAFATREPERQKAYLAEILGLHAEGRILPYISTRLPLARAAEGLVALGDRSSTGKIIVTIS